jgi:hypothetical protein
MELKFTTNSLIVKDGKTLQNNEQIGVYLEAERVQMEKIAPLMMFPPGTHFEVTITPIEPKKVNPTTGEIQ